MPGGLGVSGLTSSTSIARPPPRRGGGGSVPPSWGFRPENIAAPHWSIAPGDRCFDLLAALCFRSPIFVDSFPLGLIITPQTAVCSPPAYCRYLGLD